jgi:hypothetical protein
MVGYVVYVHAHCWTVVCTSFEMYLPWLLCFWLIDSAAVWLCGCRCNHPRVKCGPAFAGNSDMVQLHRWLSRLLRRGRMAGCVNATGSIVLLQMMMWFCCNRQAGRRCSSCDGAEGVVCFFVMGLALLSLDLHDKIDGPGGWVVHIFWIDRVVIELRNLCVLAPIAMTKLWLFAFDVLPRS